jgi:hypothetical protein
MQDDDNKTAEKDEIELIPGSLDSNQTTSQVLQH